MNSNLPNSLEYYPPRDMNTGWECPRCHRVYSPTTKTCDHCNPVVRTNMESSNTYIGVGNLPQQLNEGN